MDKNENKLLTANDGAEKTDPKMTIYEYEEKYVKRQNSRAVGGFIKVLAAIIGIGLFTCLFTVAYKVYEMNPYAGIAAAVVGLIVYIVFFIVPLIKILRSDYFITNVNSRHAQSARKHNKKLRKKIAEKIVDFNASVDGAGWYSDEVVTRLELALKEGDESGILRELSALYNGSVKSSVRAIVGKAALKSGLFSAISQSGAIDAALIAAVNLQMIKDIVFLYGFRPSDAKLIKIFVTVLQNSLVAYGLGSFKIGNGVVKTMGDAIKGIPVLGSVISTLVDSSVQGLSNAALTAVVGFQTVRYLNFEYKLQTVLDGVDMLNTEKELEQTVAEVESQLKKSGKKKAV